MLFSRIISTLKEYFNSQIANRQSHHQAQSRKRVANSYKILYINFDDSISSPSNSEAAHSTICVRFHKRLGVRRGHQLDQVQRGREPDDWKPMNTVGRGVREIRIRDAAGAFRLLYVAKFDDAVYVLHCFQKKTQKTSKADLNLAAQRYRDLLKELDQSSKKRFANVWDSIEDTPGQAENMKLRSALIMALKDHIARTGLSQSEAAKLLGVTQPRISDLDAR